MLGQSAHLFVELSFIHIARLCLTAHDLMLVDGYRIGGVGMLIEGPYMAATNCPSASRMIRLQCEDVAARILRGTLSAPGQQR